MKRVILLFAFSFLLNSCSLIFKFQGKEGDADVGEDMDSYEFNDFDVSDNQLEILPDEDLNDNQEIEDEIEEEIAPICGNLIVDSGEECDDGRNGNQSDGCKDDCTYSCHSDNECDDGHDCTQNSCNLSSHTCNYQPLASGTVCRPSSGDCTTEIQCDGINEDCPVNLQISAVSAGGYYTCALSIDGGGLCWGANSEGQLGDRTNVTKTTPVNVYGLSDIKEISAGGQHTCALLNDGGVKCWGKNEDGQLGNGNNSNSSNPVDVTGLTSGVKTISSGSNHSCAVLSSWNVKCWGQNAYAQLGDGATPSLDKNTPIDVIGLSNVKSVSAGGKHTCALLFTGGIKCWGWNESGQLGNGTAITCEKTPVAVTTLTSGVKAISAGFEHTCALLNTGGIKCWGNNQYSQLGDGTNENRNTPVDVTGLTSGVTAISAGFSHTCALLDTGGVKCWGNNQNGQLGDGTIINRSTPVDVVGLTSGVTAISCGYYHTCALLNNGAVKCWGGNVNGQLGDGTEENKLIPVYVCQ